MRFGGVHWFIETPFGRQLVEKFMKITIVASQHGEKSISMLFIV
jgi:hypothetical protein